MPTIETHADLLVPGKAIGHLATLGPHGEVQNNPVWFLADPDGGAFRFNVATTRRKYWNIISNPQVALSVVDPEDPYRYLELRGRVDHMDPDTDLAWLNTASRCYLDKEYPWAQPDEQRVVVSVHVYKTSRMG